jgi:2'-5' RNA ligase
MKYMVRCFLCVWPSEEIVKNALKLQEQLIQLPMKIKLVEKNNLHVTISFLGEKTEVELKTIKKVVDEVTKKYKGFNVKIEGLNAIPSMNYVRVIALGIKDEKLSEISKEISKTLNGKFHPPHLTLCRVKFVLDKDKVKNFLLENLDYSLGKLKVDNIALVKSVLTPKGPIYTTIHKSYLRG